MQFGKVVVDLGAVDHVDAANPLCGVAKIFANPQRRSSKPGAHALVDDCARVTVGISKQDQPDTRHQVAAQARQRAAVKAQHTALLQRKAKPGTGSLDARHRAMEHQFLVRVTLAEPTPDPEEERVAGCKYGNLTSAGVEA